MIDNQAPQSEKRREEVGIDKKENLQPKGLHQRKLKPSIKVYIPKSHGEKKYQTRG